MLLLIYTAHTGAYTKADPHSFTSIDELRKWIERNIGLPISCQIIMTSRGTNVRAQTLSNERELFVFDRRLLDASASVPVEPTPKIQTPTPFPDSIDSETEMSSWRSLFKKRLTWSESVLQYSQNLVAQITETDITTRHIQRGVQVAFSNLESHTLGLTNSVKRLKNWADRVLSDQEVVLREWEPGVKRLVRIPVHEELKGYGQKEGGGKLAVLADFFDTRDVQVAAANSSALARRFEKEITDLGDTIDEICGRTKELKADIQQTRMNNIEQTLKMLIEEIDVLVKKVRTDYDYVRELHGPKAVSTASKRAYASTTEYLPGLTNIINDVSRLYQQTVQQKNTMSGICVRQLQGIAYVQSVSAPINPQINKLDTAYQEDDASIRILSLVLKLPGMYGSLLVECVRRREWSEKFVNDSKRVAEELASMKEDEEKRRKRWQRTTGSMLPFTLEESSQILRAELTTRGDITGGFPKVNRVDVEAFLTTIKVIEGMETVYKDVSQLLQDIDKPTKRNKRLKGFKLGSIHEAAMGASSYFGGKNDEEVKTLKEEKKKLAERVKGYESRIRKLEDILHKGRTMTGQQYAPSQPPPTPVGGQPPPFFPQQGVVSGPPPQAPSPEQTSHQGTISNQGTVANQGTTSRRVSTEYGEQNVVLMAKIAALEAELEKERETTARLQKEASVKADAEKVMTEKISQADDTKRDLVANLEALDAQHIAERKEAQKEIDELKAKLEEADDEYERLEALMEERTKSLEGELALLSQELDRTKGIMEDEVGNVKILEGQVDKARKEKDEAVAEMRKEIEEIRRRQEEEAQRAGEAEAELEKVEKTNRRLVEGINGLEDQLKKMKESLEENRAQHDGYAKSQEDLLVGLKKVWKHLVTHAPPEDTEILMQRIEEMIVNTVEKNRELSSDLEEQRSKVSELDASNSRLQSRFDSRHVKIKDLTQRLYTYNVRSIQLLESIGYRILRSEDSMQIVKVPRSANNADSTILTRSTNLNSFNHNSSAEASSPANKTSPPPSSLTLSSAEDIKLLYWMETSDSETESENYSQYLKKIGSFDLDCFADTVVSRVKKTEADARQIMKQGRAYREKYYRSRDEAADKIAYRAFKVGDLALFLPTRNQIFRPWAAFNVGAPHYFLREEQSHKLATRDWLLARITKIEDRVVDLSRSTASMNLPMVVKSGTASTNTSEEVDEENPFELSDGLRWYLLDAVEEKAPGAPSTPGLATSTVAAVNVDVKGSVRKGRPAGGSAKETLREMNEVGRRSSSASGHRSEALEAVEALKAEERLGSAGSGN
ncbi:hypothetical protein RUND412_007165 [Rhizina undulata]